MENLKAGLEARAKTFQQLLQEEGYGAKAPEWDDNTRTWDIPVKCEGFSMLLMLDLDDPDFIRVILPNFYEIEPEQLGSALIALDLANKKCKVAKVCLTSNRTNTIAAAEFLDTGSGMTAPILVRYLRTLVAAAKFYVENFREQENAS